MVYLDVSKVDLGVAHITMGYTHVSSVLSIFRRMLQMFLLDVSKADLVARVVMATHMFQTHVSSVSSVFICMLQMFLFGCFKSKSWCLHMSHPKIFDFRLCMENTK
jgi:hypothetical protein